MPRGQRRCPGHTAWPTAELGFRLARCHGAASVLLATCPRVARQLLARCLEGLSKDSRKVLEGASKEIRGKPVSETGFRIANPALITDTGVHGEPLPTHLAFAGEAVAACGSLAPPAGLAELFVVACRD